MVALLWCTIAKAIVLDGRVSERAAHPINYDSRNAVWENMLHERRSHGIGNQRRPGIAPRSTALQQGLAADNDSRRLNSEAVSPPAGVIDTYAGNGYDGDGPDGGPATSASLAYPVR